MRRFHLLLFVMAFAVITYGQSSVSLRRHLGPFDISLREPSTRTVTSDHEFKKLNTTSPVDNFITAIMSQYNIPGLAACIVWKDSIMWQGYYGYADISKNKPVTDSTIFMLASISKTIIATALMQLYEQSKFKLDDSINAYLPFPVRNPKFPATAITFRMLLTHTSSIMDNGNVMPYQLGDYPMPVGTYLQKYFTPGEEYYNPSLNFHTYAPGTNFDYSNIGGTLAGYLVEVISGMPFDQYCRDSVFVPLQMSNTAWFLRDLDTTLIARPYTYSSGAQIDNGLWGHPFYPCVQLRTTAASLARFLMANINGGELKGVRILDSATVRMMRTVYIPTLVGDWSEYQMGLIWYKEKFSGRGLWGHGGWWAGVKTLMFLSDVDSTGVIILSNTDTDFGTTILLRLMEEADILLGIAFAHDVAVDRKYSPPGLDSICITTTLANPLHHIASISAVVTDEVGIVRDSVLLFNDGLHGDGSPGDSIWGCRIGVPSDEEVFSVSVRTDDITQGKFRQLSNAVQFTTSGPLTLDSVGFSKSTSYYKLKPYIRNKGASFTFHNAMMTIRCNDTWFTKFSPSSGVISLPDLPPGTSISPSSMILIYYNKAANPTYFNLKFDFSVDGVLYWTDSTKLTVTGVEEKKMLPITYELRQNFPDPFNPTTVISYQLPVSSYVTLKIFDLLGREVAALVNERKDAGVHEITFNASGMSSGVYFYRLQVRSLDPAGSGAGDFVQTKKLMILK